jgi:hypothetical protein
VLVAASGGPPAHYYAGPAVCGLGLAAVLVGVRGRTGWTPVAAVSVVAASFMVAFLPHWLTGQAPFRTNLATTAQYATIAAQLPRDGLVVNRGEIGVLAYFCLDHGCRVVDGLLADPTRTDEYVERWRAEHPWTAPNYWWRTPSERPDHLYEIDYRWPAPRAEWPVTNGSTVTGAAVLTSR